MTQNLHRMPGFTATATLGERSAAYVAHLQPHAGGHVVQAAVVRRRVYCYVSSTEGVVCIVY